MHPFTPGTFRSMFPGGKSYLFDIGAGHWNEGSLTWFVTVWSKRNIVFDEIYGAAFPHCFPSGECAALVARHASPCAIGS